MLWLFVFCSGIQFYLLLSPYLRFISFLYFDLYVLGNDALISLGSFMQTKYLCLDSHLNYGWGLRRETGLNPPVQQFYWSFQGGTSFVEHLCFLSCVCYAFVRVCLFVPCGHLLTLILRGFTDRSKAVLLLWIFYGFFCLFICALWSPAMKGLTSWLSFVVSNCESVTFQLVCWVRCTWLYRFLIFAPLLTLEQRLPPFFMWLDLAFLFIWSNSEWYIVLTLMYATYLTFIILKMTETYWRWLLREASLCFSRRFIPTFWNWSRFDLTQIWTSVDLGLSV